MKSIFSFNEKKSFLQAVLFYFVSCIGVIISAIVFASFISFINDSYEYGYWLGVAVATLFTAGVGFKIKEDRKKTTSLNTFLMIASVLLSAAFGIFAGMIPMTIVTMNHNV